MDSDRLSTESRTALCRLLRPPYLDWNEISEFASVIPGLVDRGYVERKSYTINHSGCDPVPGVLPLTLTLFAITEKGRVVLNRELRETVLELQQRSE